jgi:hypothetical protein
MRYKRYAAFTSHLFVFIGECGYKLQISITIRMKLLSEGKKRHRIYEWKCGRSIAVLAEKTQKYLQDIFIGVRRRVYRRATSSVCVIR